MKARNLAASRHARQCCALYGIVVDLMSGSSDGSVVHHASAIGVGTEVQGDEWPPGKLTQRYTQLSANPEGFSLWLRGRGEG